jgi:hypothetical protein
VPPWGAIPGGRLLTPPPPPNPPPGQALQGERDPPMQKTAKWQREEWVQNIA